MSIKPVDVGQQTLTKEMVSSKEVSVASKVEMKQSFEKAKQNLEETKEKSEFQSSQVDKVLENFNNIVKIFDVRLEFSIHEETDRIMVTVKNIETNEVVREIPPKKVLDLAAKIMEMVGILIDEKA